MKIKIAIFFMFFLNCFLFADNCDRPANFDFSIPESLVGKLSIEYRDLLDYYSKKEFILVPTTWEISMEDGVVISFSTVSDSGGSWYNRDFIYDTSEDGYVFTIFQYGGRTQKMKFTYNDCKIECYIKMRGIGVSDTSWQYVGEVIYLLENYQP